MADDNTLRNDQQESQVIVGTVGDATDAHTPDPVQPPVVAAVPDPPTPQHEGLSELRTVVEGLATSVASLTELVTSQLPKDESPNSVPWTHYGSKHKEGE